MTATAPRPTGAGRGAPPSPTAAPAPGPAPVAGARPCLDATYVLPLRAARPRLDLAEYLEWLAGLLPLVVVDGSAPDVFAAHARHWPRVVRHRPVDPDLRCANGKVAGVLTGLRHATTETVVLADDDVRYDQEALRRLVGMLAGGPPVGADLVVPQNVFAPLPWHARWDSGRTLVNRAFGTDYPGTLGIRRSVVLGAGGYDGDVLFENLELLRTVRAAGGRVVTAPDLFVRRLPPTAEHFLRQRVRQAYDSLAQPGRLAAELALLPLAAVVVRRRGLRGLAALAGTAVAVGEVGRRRHRGATVFPAALVWWTPLWIAERAVCAWLALGARVLRGGVRYGDTRLRRAANPPRRLRRPG